MLHFVIISDLQNCLNNDDYAHYEQPKTWRASVQRLCYGAVLILVIDSSSYFLRNLHKKGQDLGTKLRCSSSTKFIYLSK